MRIKADCFHLLNIHTTAARGFTPGATPAHPVAALPKIPDGRLPMTCCDPNFRSLRRPRILVRAARWRRASYRRERDLKRLLGTMRTPGHKAGLTRLVALESTLERNRVAGHATYDIGQHVEVLAALIAELETAHIPVSA